MTCGLSVHVPGRVVTKIMRTVYHNSGYCSNLLAYAGMQFLICCIFPLFIKCQIPNLIKSRVKPRSWDVMCVEFFLSPPPFSIYHLCCLFTANTQFLFTCYENNSILKNQLICTIQCFPCSITSHEYQQDNLKPSKQYNISNTIKLHAINS